MGFQNIFIKHFEDIKNSLIFASIKRTFKKRFLFVIRSFIVSYQKVMTNCKKTVGKKGTMLAVFYIRCSQMIGYQVYTEGSKPQRNTLL